MYIIFFEISILNCSVGGQQDKSGFPSYFLFLLYFIFQRNDKRSKRDKITDMSKVNNDMNAESYPMRNQMFSKKYAKYTLLYLAPAIIVLGNLLRYLIPSINDTPYDKDGLLNVAFVKKGWFWTTLVCALCLLRYDGGQANTRSRYSKTVRRYIILTIWWYLFTQGIPAITKNGNVTRLPPIMDWIFVLSGGLCSFDVFGTDAMGSTGINASFQDTATRRKKSLMEIYRLLTTFAASAAGDPDPFLENSINSIEKALKGDSNNIVNATLHSSSQLVTAQTGTTGDPAVLNSYIRDKVASVNEMIMSSSFACKRHGGYWTGGHDPSGHVFLLTLMIMFTLGEFTEIFPQALDRLADARDQFLLWGKVLLTTGPVSGYIKHSRNMSNSKADNNGRTAGTARSLLFAIFVWPQIRCLKAILRLTRLIIWDNPIVLLIAMILTWIYCLLVTSLKFHTLLEQYSGFSFAYVVAYSLYR